MTDLSRARPRGTRSIGCALVALMLSAAGVMVVVRGCPGDVARWTGRPEGQVVVKPGMTREHVQREATVTLGQYGDSGRFVDFELTTDRIAVPGIQMFRLDAGEDGRIVFVSMLSANESWQDLVKAAMRTEEQLLENGWEPLPGQPSIRSLTTDPRKAAADVTESGEIASTRFIYRKGTQEFQVAAGGLWSGIPWWLPNSYARSFWRNMNYFPLGNSYSQH